MELGRQEGPKIADVEGGLLKVVMVKGAGMAVVKVGPPVGADGHAGLSGKKEAPAKEKPPLRVRVDSYLTGVITSKNPPGHHGCHMAKLDQTGESVLAGVRDFKLGEPGGWLPCGEAKKREAEMSGAFRPGVAAAALSRERDPRKAAARCSIRTSAGHGARGGKGRRPKSTALRAGAREQAGLGAPAVSR